MFSLILLVLIGKAAASCSLNQKIFDCTGLLENSCFEGKDNIVCSNANNTQCKCKGGYLWLEGSDTICNYKQFPIRDTALIQGLCMLAGVGGVGECYIGNIGPCVGQIIMTPACICVLACAASIVALCLSFITEAADLATPLSACFTVLLMIAGFIWWLVDLVHIAQGKVNDGNGCPLY